MVHRQEVSFTKMIVDATTPIALDIRGDYGQELDNPQDTEVWHDKARHPLIKEMRK